MKSHRKKRSLRFDTAADRFPALSERGDNQVFRLTCELKDDVDPTILQEALNKTMRVFPHFKCVLDRGLFFYYLTPANLPVQVSREDLPVCAPLYEIDQRNLLFRVSYYRRRVHVEMFRIFTECDDPTRFLKILIGHYMAILHPSDSESILDAIPTLDGSDLLLKKWTASFLDEVKGLEPQAGSVEAEEAGPESVPAPLSPVDPFALMGDPNEVRIERAELDRQALDQISRENGPDETVVVESPPVVQPVEQAGTERSLPSLLSVVAPSSAGKADPTTDRVSPSALSIDESVAAALAPGLTQTTELQTQLGLEELTSPSGVIAPELIPVFAGGEVDEETVDEGTGDPLMEEGLDLLTAPLQTPSVASEPVMGGGSLPCDQDLTKQSDVVAEPLVGVTATLVSGQATHIEASGQEAVLYHPEEGQSGEAHPVTVLNEEVIDRFGLLPQEPVTSDRSAAEDEQAGKMAAEEEALSLTSAAAATTAASTATTAASTATTAASTATAENDGQATASDVSRTSRSPRQYEMRSPKKIVKQQRKRERSSQRPTHRLAHRVIGTRPAGEGSAVLEGMVSRTDLINEARRYKVDTDVYLTALLIYSIGMDLPNGKAHRPIVIACPVRAEVRKALGIDADLYLQILITYPWKQIPVFETLIDEIDHQFAEKLRPEILQRQAGRLARRRKLRYRRHLPLFIKNLILKFHERFHETRITAYMDDIGEMDFPEPMQHRIYQLGYCLAGRLPRLGVVSSGDRTVLTFASPFKDTGIQRHFFVRLSRSGFDVSVATNIDRKPDVKMLRMIDASIADMAIAIDTSLKPAQKEGLEGEREGG